MFFFFSTAFFPVIVGQHNTDTVRVQNSFVRKVQMGISAWREVDIVEVCGGEAEHIDRRVKDMKGIVINSCDEGF